MPHSQASSRSDARMNLELLWVVGLLATTVALFIHNRLRLDVIALLVIMAFSVSGTLTLNEALAGFSDPSVILIAALFVIGEGLVRTGGLPGRRLADRPRRQQRSAPAGTADAGGGRVGLGDEFHRGGGDLHPGGPEHRRQAEDPSGPADDAAGLRRTDQRHDDPGRHATEHGGQQRAGARGSCRLRLLRLHPDRPHGARHRRGLHAAHAQLAERRQPGGSRRAEGTADPARPDPRLSPGRPRTAPAGPARLAVDRQHPGRTATAHPPGRQRGRPGAGTQVPQRGGQGRRQHRAEGGRRVAAGRLRPSGGHGPALRRAEPGAPAVPRQLLHRPVAGGRHGRGDSAAGLHPARQERPGTGLPFAVRAQRGRPASRPRSAHRRHAGREAAPGRYPAGDRRLEGDPPVAGTQPRFPGAQPAGGDRRGGAGPEQGAARPAQPGRDGGADGQRGGAQRGRGTGRLPVDGPVPLHRHGRRLPRHPLAKPGPDRRHAALRPGPAEDRRYRPGGLAAGRRPRRRRPARAAGQPVPAHRGHRPVHLQHRYRGADGADRHRHRQADRRLALPLRHGGGGGGLGSLHDADFLAGEHPGAGPWPIPLRRLRPDRRAIYPAGDVRLRAGDSVAVSIVTGPGARRSAETLASLRRM
ncbi:hypothetical protein HMPREF3150_01143 [Pseudomonas aeruginosa]|nr:hypothetical protein HMPREF3150_01143 [Pseudomonas aeruginosa]